MIDRMSDLWASAASQQGAVTGSSSASPALLDSSSSLPDSPAPGTPRARAAAPATRRRSFHRGGFGSSRQSHVDTEGFLTQLADIRQGPLHDLQRLLADVQALHGAALRATTAQAERETMHRVEACVVRASAAAGRTCSDLKALAELVAAAPNATEASMRRQSFSGVYHAFQNALNTYFQAQQTFRTDMQAKVSRQLRAAFPDADDPAIAAVSASQLSAASAIQDTVQLQSGTGPLDISVALEATLDRRPELEQLAKAARELRQLFLDVEIRVYSQGEVIDDIEQHVIATRTETVAARVELERASALRTVWRRRLCCMGVTIVVCITAVVVVFVVRPRFL